MSSSTHSSATALDVLIVDLQGNLRGKRLPQELAGKALDGGTRLPLSTQLLNIWGDDCDHITERALSQGDPDGACIPSLSTLQEVPWRSKDREQQVLTTLCHDDGTPSAKELQIYDLRVRDRLEALIDRIESYAKALDIPVTTSLLEFGPAQVKINLAHRQTALQAADDAIMFKRMVDRAAFDEGLFEQRVAGADANPYHVLTLLIEAVMDGLNSGEKPQRAALAPGEPQSAANFTHGWITAIDAFQHSNFTKNALGEDYQQLYAKIKRHEAAKLMASVSNVDWQTYLPQL